MQILAEPYAPTIRVHAAPRPLPAEVPLMEVVDAYADVTRARVRARGGLNEQRPVLREVRVDPCPAAARLTLSAWRGDWAFTCAAQRYAAEHPGVARRFPQVFAGPVGVAVVVLAGDKVVLSRRSMHVTVGPGTISSTANEAVCWADLVEGPGGGLELPVQAVAARAVAEELGLALPPDAFEPTCAVDFGDGLGVGLGVRVVVGGGVEHVLAAHATARDQEGTLLVVDAREAVALTCGAGVNVGTDAFVAAALA